MERRRKDTKYGSKENTITNLFKVRKSLFDTSGDVVMKDSDSPISCPSPLMTSPVKDLKFDAESPYALFKVKKRRILHDCNSGENSSLLKFSTPKKPTQGFKEKNQGKEKVAVSSLSINQTQVELAVNKSILNPDLIGDFSKPCCLPTVNGKNPDLKTVTPETVANILQSCESFTYKLIDCRYPYEFNGGHIKNAENIYVKEDIRRLLDNEHKIDVLIFYCEFSSKRGPDMLRFLRKTDRFLNKNHYPRLQYPELYVMEGGYQAFYSSFKELCEPQKYTKMLNKDCAKEFMCYKTESRRWERNNSWFENLNPH